jgi:hypothetical protein
MIWKSRKKSKLKCEKKWKIQRKSKSNSGKIGKMGGGENKMEGKGQITSERASS